MSSESGDSSASQQGSQASLPRSPRLASLRVEVSSATRDFVSGHQRVTLVPLKIRRMGNRSILTPPPGSASALSTGAEDLAMLRTLGKAFYWQKLLEQGTYRSIGELAAAVKLDKGWVAEVLRLTTLAPDIIESILEARQPRHLNLATLRGRPEQLPREWHAQRVMLGYAE